MATFQSYVRRRRFAHHTGGYSYLPTQMATLCGFPRGLDGSGRSIALIELGGGFVQADLDQYFRSMQLKPKPVEFVSVQGGTNSPGDPNGADGEVMLDLCVAGGLAPGAQLVVYMAPNTDAGFAAAINRAVADGVDAVSVSWGAAESQWSLTSIQAMEAAFLAAKAKGIVVTVAAGDNGSKDGTRRDVADYPASSQYVLGCGGTSTVANGTQLMSEVVWNNGRNGGATGGGISGIFRLPPWQPAAVIPGGQMRGVPDVAGNADPETGWNIIVDGQQMVIGGTSAVAPMWAAIVAILNQALGKKIGLLQPALYALPATSGAFRDITQGNNGTYAARAGYDCCTGLGVPNVTNLLAALAGPVVVPTPVPIPSPTEIIIPPGNWKLVKVDGLPVAVVNNDPPSVPGLQFIGGLLSGGDDPPTVPGS